MDLNPRIQLFLPTFEGSSSGSNHSNDHSVKNRSCPKMKMPNFNVNFSRNQTRPKAVKEQPYESKNLVAERKGRNKIKDGLFALRALVPKISNMDRASIIGDVIEYIQELESNMKQLQDEKREMADEDSKHYDDKQDHAESIGEFQVLRNSLANEQKHSANSADKKKEIEVQVEVSKIGERDFLVEFICKKKRGMFMKLMAAMGSLGLQVIDANVTTFNGRILNVLRVESQQDDQDVRLMDLKETLIELMTNEEAGRLL